MARKKQRFFSEAAILKAIYAQEKLAQEQLAKADAIEDLMRSLRADSFPNKKEFELELNYLRKMANAARRSAQRASTKRLYWVKGWPSSRLRCCRWGFRTHPLCYDL